MSSTKADVVRRFMTSFSDQDVETAARLLSDDLSFTSPQDDHIDKATYLERCFPTADHFASQQLMDLVEVSDDTVFLRYEYELANGDRFRNVEAIRVVDGRIAEIEVHFGGAE